MKKIALVLGAFAFVLLSAGSASAAFTVNDDSMLTYLKDRFMYTEVSNNNNATIFNTVHSNATTGGNTISAAEDVEDGHITSGDAEAMTEVESVANDIDSEVDVTSNTDSGTCNTCSGNVSVDDDSDADLTDTSHEDVFTDNNNTSLVFNTVGANATSGGNTVESTNDDVEGGSIESGSTNSGSMVTNAFNILRSRITRN